jgi:hypothetical protein
MFEIELEERTVRDRLIMQVLSGQCPDFTQTVSEAHQVPSAAHRSSNRPTLRCPMRLYIRKTHILVNSMYMRLATKFRSTGLCS